MSRNRTFFKIMPGRRLRYLGFVPPFGMRNVLVHLNNNNLASPYLFHQPRPDVFICVGAYMSAEMRKFGVAHYQL